MLCSADPDSRHTPQHEAAGWSSVRLALYPGPAQGCYSPRHRQQVAVHRGGWSKCQFHDIWAMSPSKRLVADSSPAWGTPSPLGSSQCCPSFSHCWTSAMHTSVARAMSWPLPHRVMDPSPPREGRQVPLLIRREAVVAVPACEIFEDYPAVEGVDRRYVTQVLCPTHDGAMVA